VNQKSLAIGTRRLPAAADLAFATNLGSVIETISEIILPLSIALYDLEQAEGNKRLQLVEQLAIPLPPEFQDYPAVLRDLVKIPPDAAAIGKLVGLVIDTRTGYRPTNVGGYALSIVECLARRGFSLPVVQLACVEIREADPASLHNQLPSEFHFIAACERARKRLEYLSERIESVLAIQPVARSSLARRLEIGEH
jgi:hypothetical protein